MGIVRLSLLGEYHTADAADGATHGSHGIFGCHKAPQLISTVHHLEHRFKIDREDRVCRLVTSVADQAIQGPDSTQFAKHERAVDGVDERPCQKPFVNFT